jgi:tetratricopeptide (TPR) repeat protein
MPMVRNSGTVRCAFLLLSILVLGMVCSDFAVLAQTDEDSLAAALESARRKQDPVQLASLKTQLQQRLSQNRNDAVGQYELSRVESYLADQAEIRKDKKAAAAGVDKAIEAVQHSLQLNENSADAHSLLADLYGRKISLGGGLFAGPRFGPKVGEENKRAMALDNKNPRVWASTGRQYLMAPKAFGGDTTKAIDSFKKSLALDPNQDETWVWLARAYEKQSDKAGARDAIRHALQLNPQSMWAQETSKSLEN